MVWFRPKGVLSPHIIKSCLTVKIRPIIFFKLAKTKLRVNFLQNVTFLSIMLRFANFYDTIEKKTFGSPACTVSLIDLCANLC